MPSNTESTDALAIAREQITKEIKEDLRTGSGEWYNVFSSSSAEPSVLEQMAAIRIADNHLLGDMTAKASATLDQGEVKLERMFAGHLTVVQEMCLKVQRGGISDTDIKLLGPRLKAVSDSFMKNTQEMDLKVKNIEKTFVDKTADMRRMFENEQRKERTGAEEKIHALTNQVQEERLKGEQKLKAQSEESEKALLELQEKVDKQSRLNAERMKQKEQEFEIKQNTILNALKNSAAKEEEKARAAVLDAQARAARDQIARMRDVSDMEHQAELAATNKFNAMVESLREQWAENEEERVRTIEERARVDCQVEIATLKAELSTSKKMAADTQTKWMDVVTKQNYEHHDALELFAEKCRKTYDDKLSAMTERIAQQFGMYERQLLESDKDLTEQAMNFENKLYQMKLSTNEWKEDYRRQIDTTHLEAVAALENKYTGEIDKLLQQVSGLQDLVNQTGAVTVDSSRSRMDGMLSNFIKLKKALELNSNEQIALLMKLLQSSDFSPKLLQTYSKLESKLSDQLPVKKMATRREFVKYRLNVITRFGETGTTVSSNTTRRELIEELSSLTPSIKKAIREYEEKWETQFLFEGKCYMDVVAEDETTNITEINV
ncbi:hypothetical protein TL16_g01421 [Triparma laevis f. inornata]|uniref:Uncharacterized protein n=1 Tax=Triparma laevis f. inornata TaxID=1714386 RepID=A0A9W6ZMM9_9STRA|nr:hypothetical protein TL16_g01421 [Triparma laevis f. inornata]